MLDLSLFVCAAALFDSVSTAQQIVILVLLFSTAHPIRNSLAFIVGVTLAYCGCGLIGLLFVDQLNALVKLFIPNLGAFSDAQYYQSQLLTGIVLALAGPLYAVYKIRSKKPPMENRWITGLAQMKPWMAGLLGAFLSASSFPAALPYVAAIEKIAAAPLTPLAKDGFILLYNLVYALPLLIPFGLFALLREAILPKLHLHIHRLNLWITIFLLSGMGLFLMADSASFFWWAKPLVANRFL